MVTVHGNSLVAMLRPALRAFLSAIDSNLGGEEVKGMAVFFRGFYDPTQCSFVRQFFGVVVAAWFRWC